MKLLSNFMGRKNKRTPNQAKMRRDNKRHNGIAWLSEVDTPPAKAKQHGGISVGQSKSKHNQSNNNWQNKKARREQVLEIGNAIFGGRYFCVGDTVEIDTERPG